MISNRQKALLHMYANAAGLSRPAYRNILREHASVSSAADPNISNAGFRRAMAALEVHLDKAMANGAPRIRIPYRRGYWQSIIPVTRTAVSHTKVNLINSLADQLSLTLPGLGFQRDQYIQGTINRATGRHVTSPVNLTDRQADAVIAALRAVLARHPVPEHQV